MSLPVMPLKPLKCHVIDQIIAAHEVIRERQKVQMQNHPSANTVSDFSLYSERHGLPPDFDRSVQTAILYVREMQWHGRMVLILEDGSGDTIPAVLTQASRSRRALDAMIRRNAPIVGKRLKLKAYGTRTGILPGFPPATTYMTLCKAKIMP